MTALSDHRQPKRLPARTDELALHLLRCPNDEFMFVLARQVVIVGIRNLGQGFERIGPAQTADVATFASHEFHDNVLGDAMNPATKRRFLPVIVPLGARPGDRGQQKKRAIQWADEATPSRTIFLI